MSTMAKLKKLQILPLHEQLVFNSSVFMCKVNMSQAPQYVCDLLNRAPARYEYKKINYVLPRTSIDLYDWPIGQSECAVKRSWFLYYKMSLAFPGSSVWNSLPPKIKTYKPVRGFKVNLRKILINKWNRVQWNLWYSGTFGIVEPLV